MVTESKDAAMIFEVWQEKDADAVAQKTISDLPLKLIDKSNVNLNRLNAVVTLSERVSQNDAGQEQVLKILSYFIKKDAMVYTFHGLCLDENFSQHKPAFESTMKNFARLTNASKLNIQPARIKVISINSASVSLKDAFDYYKVPQDKFEEMALLNNRKLTDELKRGDMIKILDK